tara:strand:+ start:27833 stop:28246 length:414 start_codon:yes stop_codon:yes gene_type:complete
MPHVLLTTEDREWLAEQKQIIATRFEFLLQSLRSHYSQDAISFARVVPIWHNHRYIQAEAVYQDISEKVPGSQIFEQWDYRVFQDVMRACDKLSSFDAEVLLIASGYSASSDAELADACANAVSEAYDDLYREPVFD